MIDFFFLHCFIFELELFHLRLQECIESRGRPLSELWMTLVCDLHIQFRLFGLIESRGLYLFFIPFTIFDFIQPAIKMTILLAKKRKHELKGII